MTDKCPRCGKTVYFAERRLYNGNYYHQICSNKQQDDDMASKTKHFALHEDMNCNRGTPVNAAGSTGSQHENVCSSCAFRIQPDARFCSHCGAKAEIKPTPEPEPEPKQDPSVICTGCGQKYAPESRFCTGCGNKRP